MKTLASVLLCLVSTSLFAANSGTPVQWMSLSVNCRNSVPDTVDGMLIDGKITYLARGKVNSYLPVIRNRQLFIQTASSEFLIADILDYSDPTIKFKTCALDSRGEPQNAALAIPKELAVTVTQAPAGCAGPTLLGNDGTPTKWVYQASNKYVYSVASAGRVNQFEVVQADGAFFTDAQCTVPAK